MPTAVLLLSCPDQPGVVHGVAEFVLGLEGNIVHAEQHIDVESGVFFQRVEFDVPGLTAERLATSFAPVAERFRMTVQAKMTADRPRIGLLASTQPHCLTDLLARWRSGELPADVAVVVSNHPEHAELAQFHRVPFRYLPVTPETRDDQERALLTTLDEHGVELVVLARYMQILGQRVLDAYPARIINIHHSFLPAFVGARPYHQAQQRGVKLIGATAHYVTADLDEGPIIEQDVERVDHTLTPEDITAIGRDVECVVLARAVRWHVEHRVLRNGRKTVVFN